MEEVEKLKAHNAKMIETLDYIALSMSYIITQNVQMPNTIQELHPDGIPQIKRITVDELFFIIKDTRVKAIEAQKLEETQPEE